LAGYCYRLAKITGWGYREIMEELPFGAGLQMIFCDDSAHGRRRKWMRNNRSVNVDALTAIEEAMQNAQIQI
jgi:hypothetical protein